jgi:hypothetical protein
MRKFKIIKSIDVDTQKEEIKHNGGIFEFTPILSEYYLIDSISFRCVEHKPGEVKLLNNNTLILLKEIF